MGENNSESPLLVLFTACRMEMVLLADAGVLIAEAGVLVAECRCCAASLAACWWRARNVRSCATGIQCDNATKLSISATTSRPSESILSA